MLVQHSTCKNALEAFDCFLKRHQLSHVASEYFCYLERLRQETLDLTSTSHGQPIFLGQFIHTQDSNDVLQ